MKRFETVSGESYNVGFYYSARTKFINPLSNRERYVKVHV
jgi:hypothetical protein